MGGSNAFLIGDDVRLELPGAKRCRHEQLELLARNLERSPASRRRAVDVDLQTTRRVHTVRYHSRASRCANGPEYGAAPPRNLFRKKVKKKPRLELLGEAFAFRKVRAHGQGC
jgi:hypothetical protein